MSNEAKPVIVEHAGIKGMWLFHCPGCKIDHFFQASVNKFNPKGPVWTWNGERVKPTVSPSILTKPTRYYCVNCNKDVPFDECEAGLDGLWHYCRSGRLDGKIEPRERVCHSYIKDGQIQFLTDCTHALAGKTVPLEPF